MENLLFYFFLLLGLLGIALCLLAIILGVIGRIKIRKNPALISSKVRANAGIFIGIFALFASFIMSILLIYLNFYRDSDNDGFLNDVDNCPSEWGTLNGCLDTDNDYIANYQDNCENEAGPEENNGCPWPDTDLDGVLDKDDACVSEFGPVENNGCPWPDTDGDGFLDKDDACPDAPGEEGSDGCPEYNYEEEYVEEASTYKTVCPNCSSTSYETQYNITWNCGSCGEDYYGCNRKGTSNYGISLNWMNDGTCDCSDCSDE